MKTRWLDEKERIISNEAEKLERFKKIGMIQEAGIINTLWEMQITPGDPIFCFAQTIHEEAADLKWKNHYTTNFSRENLKDQKNILKKTPI